MFVALGIVAVVIGFLVKLDQAITLSGKAIDAVDSHLHPYADEYASLSALELGMNRDTVTALLGAPSRTIDVCADFPALCADGQSVPTMEVHETGNARVRTMFEGTELDFYAVTLRGASEFAPTIEWLDHDLGQLGAVTYAAAMSVPQVDPTDGAIFLGPRASAYVEIVAAGAPAHYRGLVLANLPDGRGDASFDLESGRRIDAAQIAGVPHLEAIAQFRDGSVPNTYGQFRDDGGFVSELARGGVERMLIPLLMIGSVH